MRQRNNRLPKRPLAGICWLALLGPALPAATGCVVSDLESADRGEHSIGQSEQALQTLSAPQAIPFPSPAFSAAEAAEDLAVFGGLSLMGSRKDSEVAGDSGGAYLYSGSSLIQSFRMSDIKPGTCAVDTVRLQDSLTASASSVESPDLSPQNAVDADGGSRWASSFSDNQWLLLKRPDGADRFAQRVGKIVLKWEAAFASDYEIQIPNGITEPDANTVWTTIYAQTAGRGGTETISIPDTSSQWIRLKLNRRANPSWGFSLHEVELHTASSSCGILTVGGCRINSFANSWTGDEVAMSGEWIALSSSQLGGFHCREPSILLARKTPSGAFGPMAEYRIPLPHLQAETIRSLALEGNTLAFTTDTRFEIWEFVNSSWVSAWPHQIAGASGLNVALSGDRAVLGYPAASGASGFHGLVLVYQKVNGQWTFLAAATGPAADSGFGRAVDIDGSLIAAASDSSGISLLRLDQGALQTEFVDSSYRADSISLQGGLLLAGRSSNVTGGDYARWYERENGVWTSRGMPQRAQLSPLDYGADDVEIDGSTLLIGTRNVAKDGFASNGAMIRYSAGPANQPPTVSVSSLPPEAVVGQALTATASVLDPDGPNPPSFEWWQEIKTGDTFGPATLFSTGPTLNFTPPAPGVYRFEVRVSDGQNVTRNIFTTVSVPASNPNTIYQAALSRGGLGTASCTFTKACTDSGSYIDLNEGSGYRWDNVQGNGRQAQLFFKISVPSGSRSMDVWVNNVRVGQVSGSSVNYPRPNGAELISPLPALLSAGSNTVELRDINGSTAEFDVHHLRVLLDDSPPPPPPACGDAACNGTESCSTCEQDCGQCPDGRPMSERLEAESNDGMQGIEFQATTDQGGGQNAAYIANGDYIEWDVNFITATYYQVETRSATWGSASLEIHVDGQVRTTMNLPATWTGSGSQYQTWRSFRSEPIGINGGVHKIRVQFKSGNQNLNYIQILPPTANNLLSNGNFANGSIAWATSLSNSTVSYAGGFADFTINAASANDWEVQLRQNVSLIGTTIYTLCYDVRTDEASRSIRVTADGAQDSAYENRGLDAMTVPVDGSWAARSHTFTASMGDPTSRIVFHLGKNANDVHIDNVRLFYGQSCN